MTIEIARLPGFLRARYLESLGEGMSERIEKVRRGEIDEVLLVEAEEDKDEEGVLLADFGDHRYRVGTEELDESITRALEKVGVGEGTHLYDHKDRKNRPLVLAILYSDDIDDDVFVIEERVLTKKVEGRTISLRLEAGREEGLLTGKAKDKAKEVKGRVKDKMLSWFE